MIVLTQKGVDALRYQIVRQAIKDYKRAIGSNNADHITELESFFTSEWFLLLTTLDGRYIMNSIRKGA